ncbi:MAG TPA: UDP-N-acetylmuramate dehydrogenase [Balneolaceae bacterium]|nr:UDP-N-acetylmuramate dehydrogenase [Balneolaceae bacterium]
MTKPYDGLVKRDVDLRPYNTLHVSAKACMFAAVGTTGQLKEILRHPETKNQPLLVLGGGSNILFLSDFEGLVLRVEIAGKEVVKETNEHVWLKVGAGENWHQTVRYCVEKGWGGVENLSLIPGTVGAAPIQNIGAYGVELTDVFALLEAVEIETAETHTFKKEECRFGYRDSIFKNELKGKFVVTQVVLKLSKKPEINASYGAIQSELDKRSIVDPSIKNISDIIVDIRKSKLPNPAELGNAGSFFKNPIVDKSIFERIKKEFSNAPGYSISDGKMKVPAGWLIEQTGWKGKVVGQTGTYKQQALVIVNYGGATGKEILNLAGSIQESVKKKFRIELLPEVNIIQ